MMQQKAIISQQISKDTMNILLINQTFYPDIVSTAQHLTDFALDLTQNGHNVTVLTWRRGYAEPHPLYKAREVYRGINIIRVWPFALGRRHKLTRIFDALMLNLSFAIKLMLLPRFDRIVAMTSPPLVAWFALLFTPKRKTRFLYWVMDLNPDEAIVLGWIKKDSMYSKFLEKVSRWILHKADQIVVLDRFMEQRIAMKGTIPNKISVVPPWSHNEDLETISHALNPFRYKYHLDNKFVVMYSGNLSMCHPLNTLLESALILKDESSIIFTFIGQGDGVEQVLQFKSKNKLSNILYLPYQPRSELKYSLSAADLHVVIMGNPFVGIVHPCKIYGILAIGRPFVYIGPRDSHIGDLMTRGNVGYHVNHGEHQKLTNIITEVRNWSESKKHTVERQEKFIAMEFTRKRLSSILQSHLIHPNNKNAMN